MRLSVDTGSPYWRADGYEHQVFVDGLAIRLCVEASEEEGWATMVTTDDAGKLMLNDERTQALTHKLYGKVEIKKLDQLDQPITMRKD